MIYIEPATPTVLLKKGISVVELKPNFFDAGWDIGEDKVLVVVAVDSDSWIVNGEVDNLGSE